MFLATLASSLSSTSIPKLLGIAVFNTNKNDQAIPFIICNHKISITFLFKAKNITHWFIFENVTN